MPSLSGYQRELSFPLISGIHEDPPWTTFMQRLVEQTYARRGILVITLSNAMSSQPPAVVQVRAGRAAQEPPIDFQRISAMGLIPFGIMRPGRVYALDEMLDHGDATRRDQQRGVLKAMGICELQPQASQMPGCYWFGSRTISVLLPPRCSRHSPRISWLRCKSLGR